MQLEKQVEQLQVEKENWQLTMEEMDQEKTRLQLAQGREDFLRKKLLFFFLSLDGKMPVFRGLVAATSQFDFESKEKYFNCI